MTLYHLDIIFPGGSVDVTVFENQDDSVVRMIYKNTGRRLDGVSVNCQFKNLLDEMFGAQKMYDYRQMFTSDWLKVMSNFEANKRVFPDQSKILLPGSFVSWVNDFRSPAMKRFGVGEVRITDDKYLCLAPRVMRRLFQPLIKATRDHLGDTVMSKPRLSKIKTMILVGGLAESPLLQEEIKNGLSGRYCVITPREASVSVVQGAVFLGKRTAAAGKKFIDATCGADSS